MSIMMIKLVNGEEILCDVNVTEDCAIVNKPMVLVPQQEGVAMMPLLFFAEKQEISINLKNIMYFYKPKAEIVNAYNERVGGLVTAPAGTLDSKGKIVGV